ncbi:NAD(P)H-dependent oxidoreductase [Lacinutrix neustonica]|uniref:NAD(P)H-dependent oxidoreductase n=1 Tax=Lacinutrix neustonica TaxID=2980107 RepID=A0A9E8MWN0_9FLAO|nr:NAD(P)H-dependent oxidoreductase [Lacinutrix neustonica]WAC02696.1 NAD(P)H-dependent oxidoreductase [Lacinutrix neustonica]
MNAIDALRWRYATKTFDATKIISEEKLNILMEAFNLTATSYGLQPIKLVVLQNKALQKQLVEHSMNQEQVAQASHVFIYCIERVVDTAYIENYFQRIKTIRDTPDAIIDPFKDFLIEDFKNSPKERIEQWATKQAYLAMGNLLTVCALERIDACPMEGFSSKDYDSILHLKEKGLQSVLVMPVGYRDQDDFMSKLGKVRKELKDSVIVL